MRNKLLETTLWLTALLFPCLAYAGVRLPRLCSDGMVLHVTSRRRFGAGPTPAKKLSSNLPAAPFRTDDGEK